MCLVGLVGWLGQCDDGPRRVELSSARVTCLGSLVWVLGAADVRIWCGGWMEMVRPTTRSALAASMRALLLSVMAR